MRRLMLLRHAKSDWSQGGRDHDRDLSERGRIAAPRIGSYLAEHALIPDCVMVSTARRTRETWKLVAAALPAKPRPVFDERIYEATPDDILTAIREAPGSCQCLLVVGHNPGLQALALRLIKGGSKDDLARLMDKFPTGGLAIIDIQQDDWISLHASSGRLESFVTPRGLAENT